jgi:hypothetical protein
MLRTAFIWQGRHPRAERRSAQLVGQAVITRRSIGVISTPGRVEIQTTALDTTPEQKYSSHRKRLAHSPFPMWRASVPSGGPPIPTLRSQASAGRHSSPGESPPINPRAGVALLTPRAPYREDGPLVWAALMSLSGRSPEVATRLAHSTAWSSGP